MVRKGYPRLSIQASTGLGIVASVAFVGGFTLFYDYFRKKDEHDYDVRDVSQQPNTGSIYQEIASKFDEKVSTSEWLLGVDRFRKNLIKNAEGDVLEISTGTGRNMKYYADSKTKTLTGTDLSDKMLHRAQQKRETHELAAKTPLSFFIMDSQQLEFPSNSFDTVVDTCGLCSCDDPVKSLQEMQRVCKPDGQILLLEHGRSSWSWLNKKLDRNADRHAHSWGCWWNRDITKFIEQSGLTVVADKRYYFGTFYWIIAKPNKSPSGPSATDASSAQDAKDIKS